MNATSCATWTLSDGRKLVMVNWTTLHIHENGKHVATLDNFKENELREYLTTWFKIPAEEVDREIGEAYARRNDE